MPHNRPPQAGTYETERRNAEVVLDAPDGRLAMTQHAVAIVGGGPTGMMLAGELALAGIDVVILERRARR